MEEIYFTGDTHFGHKHILKHQFHTRPFTDLVEMDEAIIKNWNATVNRSDRVYHLGDFSFRGQAETLAILKRLNGQIHLIRGNHDKLNAEILREFTSVSDIKEVKIEGQRIVLCHYAFETWNKMHHGSWHCHGHSHGSLAVNLGKKRFDVGIDSAPELRPMHFDELKIEMDKRQFVPVDHHTA